jgi:hypothetical protein
VRPEGNVEQSSGGKPCVVGDRAKKGQTLDQQKKTLGDTSRLAFQHNRGAKFFECQVTGVDGFS